MQDKPNGLCQCGCGEPTRIAKQSKSSRGHVKGQPVRYLPGHVNRRTPHAYEVRDCGYETPCWVWVRALNDNGYGLISSRGRTRLAYRELWVRENGPVPAGHELDHLCRNTECVNPDHLEPVTHAENMRRSKRVILTAAQVREIRASTDTPLELARRYGVKRPTIYGILKGRQWKDI